MVVLRPRATAPVFQPSDPTPTASIVLAAIFLFPCIAWLALCIQRWRQYRTRLYLLLVAVWTCYTLDQLCLLLYTSLYMQCPRPFMWITPLTTSKCIAPGFLSALIILQNIAAAMFVVATISRFQDAFALLSTRNLKISRGLMVLVAVVAVARFVTSILWEIASDTPKSPVSPAVYKAFLQIDLVMHPVTFIVYGICDLTALVLGLNFVMRIQRDLAKHLSASFAAFSRTSRQAELKHSRHMVMYICASLTVLLLFVLVQTLINTTQVFGDLPLLFTNSLDTSLLKVYSSCTMLAIDGMKKVLAARQKLLEFGPSTMSNTGGNTGGTGGGNGVVSLAEWPASPTSADVPLTPIIKPLSPSSGKGRSGMRPTVMPARSRSFDDSESDRAHMYHAVTAPSTDLSAGMQASVLSVVVNGESHKK
ncbi:hypothetical protein AMAG_15766 [Allomyces macrogynus ATCC 38327]|uniref:G-protein coupled receptors family 1 profile domain-containing protein n=1 Tax=Allomyces macrogynus (strain ATCC 38327) TaxID=578462 RepID=A0A0L0TA10_ALLM3|nr:hypothetical protein AMAG_15766 [Allomyces macrogynus ATCC 38327]|eukprot:KNE71556.1 hypothetical protein AMAG_15766 [Allomyces macrogynus ATCC 38327]